MTRVDAAAGGSGLSPIRDARRRRRPAGRSPPSTLSRRRRGTGRGPPRRGEPPAPRGSPPRPPRRAHDPAWGAHRRAPVLSRQHPLKHSDVDPRLGTPAHGTSDHTEAPVLPHYDRHQRVRGALPSLQEVGRRRAEQVPAVVAQDGRPRAQGWPSRRTPTRSGCSRRPTPRRRPPRRSTLPPGAPPPARGASRGSASTWSRSREASANSRGQEPRLRTKRVRRHLQLLQSQQDPEEHEPLS